MNLRFEKWFKDILALQVEFNASKDRVRQFAILTALKADFEHNTKWLTEEVERYRKLAVSEILKRDS